MPNWLQNIIDGITAWGMKVADDFTLNFKMKKRGLSMLKGLKMTLIITLFACLLGIVIGVLVASVRTTYDKNEEAMRFRGGFGFRLMRFFNGLCKVYLTVIRGTPVVVQLMIMYFVLFASSKNSTRVAIIAFGANSAAYVAEILRGGIMSIDPGQFEAGRSLGFNYVQTMFYIIIPQVFKSTLPTLLNEGIALLKETSVAGYVGIRDITKVSSEIRGATFSAFMPLVAVALIYLAIVMGLTALVGRLERRMRRNER